MSNTDRDYICISCGKSEAETPILYLRFKGEEAAICSSCIPVLVHRPETLADRLIGADKIEPSSHKH